MVGNFVHQKDLRRGDVKDVLHHRLGALRPELGKARFEQQAVLHGGEKQAGGQPLVVRAEVGGVQMAVQRRGDVGAGARHVRERAARHLAGAKGRFLALRALAAGAEGRTARAVAGNIVLLSRLSIYIPSPNLVPGSIFLPAR